MNRALLPPLLLSVVFAVVALAEMSGREAPLRVAAPHFDSRRAPPPIRVTDTARDGQTILARPLFTANRRPSSVKGASPVGGPPPRLSAIMVSASGRSVVFDDGGKSLLARVGGRAGPYMIMSISDDRVTVLSPEGQRTLKPVPAPSDATSTGTQTADASAPATSGLSILQQLQRGQVPHYAIPPPPSIQSLIARMRNQH
jgi:hypothetical protein